MKKSIPVPVLISLLVFTACLTAFATVLSLVFTGWKPTYNSDDVVLNKTAEIKQILDNYYIDDIDETQLGDAVASAMLYATGDRWSYYTPSSDYDAFLENYSNSYCGVGITIQDDGLKDGFVVTSVTEGGPAWNSGVRAGDLLHKVEDQQTKPLGIDGTKNLVRGEKGTAVSLTFLRDGKEFSVELVRDTVRLRVVSSQRLDKNVGYVVIKNFDEDCASQLKSEVDALLKENIGAIVFDVRFNPGGHRDELVEILDYILPEGVVFQDTSYDGKTSQDLSDASCVQLPMAVLVNAETYSAAEFFAAALQEYNWAVIVGESTVGKGRYQSHFTLSDGSILSVSVGNYYTPSGISLQDVGITPDLAVSLSEQQTASLYFDTLLPKDDPQLQTALEVLWEKMGTEIS